MQQSDDNDDGNVDNIDDFSRAYKPIKSNRKRTIINTTAPIKNQIKNWLPPAVQIDLVSNSDMSIFTTNSKRAKFNCRSLSKHEVPNNYSPMGVGGNINLNVTIGSDASSLYQPKSSDDKQTRALKEKLLKRMQQLKKSQVRN